MEVSGISYCILRIEKGALLQLFSVFSVPLCLFSCERLHNDGYE